MNEVRPNGPTEASPPPHRHVRGTVVVFELQGFHAFAESASPSRSAAVLARFERIVREGLSTAGGALISNARTSIVCLFSGGSSGFLGIGLAASVLQSWKDPLASAGCTDDSVVASSSIHTDAFLCLEGGVVAGSGIDLATRLQNANSAGAILISAKTMNAALASLPEGWKSSQERAPRVGEEPDLNADLSPVSPGLRDGLIKIFGPLGPDDVAMPTFTFRYIAEIKLRKWTPPVPILRLEAAECSGSPSNWGNALAGSGPKRLGRYELDTKIGAGGMGEVWLARDPFGNPVALKTMRAPDLSGADDATRFQREAAVMSRLSHRNVVRIIEVGDAGGLQYIAMEYIEGGTLAELICGSAGLTAEAIPPAIASEEAVRLAMQICDGVQCAHQRGILHRDLKPENIMLRTSGEPVVMDFGLAKVMPTQGGDLSLSGASIVGTIGYMAPEQAQDKRAASERTDVYSIGAILYHMLASQRAFVTTKDPVADLLRLRNFVPVPPRRINRKIDRDLDTIVMAAMRLEPELRYPSVAALRLDLERYLADEPITAQTPTIAYILRRWTRKHRVAAVSSLAAAVVLVVGYSIFTIRVVGERNRAETALLKLQETAPVFFEQAQASLRDLRIEHALERIGYAVQLAPENAGYVAFRAGLLQATQDLTGAAAEYRRALQLQPDTPSFVQNLSLCEDLLRRREGRSPLPIELQRELMDALIAQGRQLEASNLAVALKRDLGDLDQVVQAKLAEFTAQPGWEGSRCQRLENGTYRIDLSRMEVSDTARLKGIPVSDLDLNRTSCSSLEGLSETPLARLSLDRAPISDLHPVADCPLKTLRASNTRIFDLTPLRRMPLEYLGLAGCLTVQDLSPLKGLQIKNLFLNGTGVYDLTPLSGMKLEALSLANTHVTNLQALRGAPLVSLDLSAIAEEVDVSPLAECAALQVLLLPALPQNVGELKKCLQLQRVTWGVRTFSAEAFWKRFGPGLEPSHKVIRPLQDSGLDHVQFGQIETEEDGTLRLNLRGSQIRTLDLLSALNISYLNIAGTEIGDLSPVRGMPLKFLDCTLTRVLDAAPLLECSLLKTVFLPKSAKNAELVTNMSTRPSVKILPDSSRNDVYGKSSQQ